MNDVRESWRDLPRLVGIRFAFESEPSGLMRVRRRARLSSKHRGHRFETVCHRVAVNNAATELMWKIRALESKSRDHTSPPRQVVRVFGVTGKLEATLAEHLDQEFKGAVQLGETLWP